MPSTSRSSRSRDTPPPAYQDVVDPLNDDAKHIYIKNVQLTLNGQPVDSLDSRETEEDCITTYWRLFQIGGFGRTLFTNGIDYEAFR